MKLLFSVQANVIRDNGKYYDNNVAEFIKMYKRYCDQMSCLCSIFDAQRNNHLEIETTGVEMINITNINSLKRMIFDEKANRAIVEKAVKEADAVVVHLPSRIGEMTIHYAKRHHKPYMVAVVSCVWDSYWHYNLKGKLIAPLSYLTTRAAIRGAKYVIYVTEKFLQNRYPTKGCSIGCSDVVLPPNAHSDEILQRRLKLIDEKSHSAEPTRLATLAAVDVPYKGQAYVLRAIALLKKRGLHYEYHIAGMGDPSALITLARSLDIEDRLIVHGVISHDKISDLLDNIDLYIQPSKQEGLPRSLIEAMSRACPALGSNIAGIPELLESDALFEKGSVEAMCDKLTYLTSSKLKQMAIRNFNTARRYNQQLLNEKRDLFMDSFINDNGRATNEYAAVDKKILHIAKYYAPYEGGIEYICRTIVNIIKSDTGCQQAVLCFNEDNRSTTDMVDGVYVHRAATLSSVARQPISLSYLFRLRELLKSYNPDYIHYHAPNPLVALLLLLCKRGDSKLLVHWHSDIVEQKYMYPFFRPLEAMLLRQSHSIFATSQNYIDGSKPLSQHKDRVSVLTNVIDNSRLELTDEVKQHAKLIRERYNDKPLVLFVGRHVPYKGIPLLIEAIKRVKSDAVFLIGGAGQITNNLKQQAAEVENIEFLGRISDDELVAMYYAADIFAFPSITKNEAFGVVLAEAMYCNTPAITFTIEGSGVNWVNLHNETGLEVENSNPTAFAEALERLISDETLRKKLGRQAKERVIKHFTTESIREQVINIYAN